MTGVEWILLLIGGIFMIGSFFITEKLSPSELNQISELSENEIKKIIDRGLEQAEVRIEDAINEQIEASADNVDRALEKETNDKIMAISEYSDTVVESMNKTHNEIMFLYSMLNDKHTELTGMASDLQRLAADVRSLEENMPKQIAQPVQSGQAGQLRQPVQTGQMRQPIQQGQVTQQAQAGQSVQTRRQTVAEPVTPESPTDQAANVAAVEVPETELLRDAAKPMDQDNSNREVLALYREGLSEIEIARRLKMGVGEVRLVIGLYRGEKDS